MKIKPGLEEEYNEIERRYIEMYGVEDGNQALKTLHKMVDFMELMITTIPDFRPMSFLGEIERDRQKQENEFNNEPMFMIVALLSKFWFYNDRLLL